MSTGTQRPASFALRSDAVSGVPARSDRRSRRWTIAAALLAFASGCGGGAGSGSSSSSADDGGTQNSTAGSGNQVAVLELAQPSIGTFVLHGTIPVPKHTFPRTDGKMPFSIQDWDGTIVPTQVEIVSRYPDDKDGADVIEVLGRVHTPPNGPSGVRLQYVVVDDPHTAKKFDVTKPVLGMISQPGTVMLVAQDVFGNSYNLDLVKDARLNYSANALRQLRQGDAASQFRTYGVMLPTGTNIGPPSGALPHLMGVHAYFTCWAKSDVISLDLRVSGGTSGLDASTTADDPMGPNYFRSLELWVKKGWKVENQLVDTAQGASYDAGTWTSFPLIGARADGKMHMLPVQAQLNRRLAICPSGKEPEARAYAREEHIGFARRGTSSSGAELYSWWNPLTARYFPQRHRLPELDHLGATAMRAKLGTSLNKITNLISTGASDISPFPTMGAMGWAYPYGCKYGGMTGGTEIFLLDGLTTADSASNEGYRLAQTVHRMTADREAITLFNKDGDPTKLSQWVIHGSQGDYLNFFFFLVLQKGPDPFGMGNYPKFQETYVTNNNLAPPYKTNLDSYSPIDYQHYIRYTRSPKVLAWLGNDAIAKDDLWMAAELFRLWYHDMPTCANGSTKGGMLSDIASVTSHPASGFAFGRGEGWGIDTMSAAYSLNSIAWRQEALPWFQKVSDLVSNGQIPCSGFVMRVVNAKNLGGLFQTRQAYEEAIWQNGMHSALESALRDADPARAMATEDVLRAGALGMIGPVGWSPTGHAPWGQTAVMPLNQWTPYCQTLPPGGHSTGLDKYYTWTTLAYGFELTGDTTFLSMADQMAGGNVVTIFENAGFKDLENRGALLATCQQGSP